MTSDMFGINCRVNTRRYQICPLQGRTDFVTYLSGLHPTLSNKSLSAINREDMESVDALIHKTDDRASKEFEKWAILTYSDNRAMINEKKGADKGIDGVAYTRKSRDEVLPVMLSVKSGKNVGVSEVRDLFGVVQSESAACGIYISRCEPTKPMIEFAKQQGQFKPENFPAFNKLQIVTVQEILDGAKMNLPLMEEVTKKAQRAKSDNHPNLFGN